MPLKKGLSLIELLVVIAIVTLTAGVLMPALNNQRSIAKQTLCQSNLKQWGIIFKSYTQENNDKFGKAWYSSSNPDHQWLSSVKPYYDDPNLLFCPQARRPVVEPNDALSGGIMSVFSAFKPSDAWGRFPLNEIRPGYAGAAGSYGINCWLENPYILPYGKYPQGYSDWYWVQINQPNVSNVPLIMDCRWMGGFAGKTTTGTSGSPDAVAATEDELVMTSQMTRYCVNRHNGYINGTFLDLSVRKIGLKELWNLKWHQKYNTANSQTKRTAAWPAWMRDFTNYFTD